MFSLGQRIRELRLKKGITQIDLSKGICTPSMISQIESDRARPSYKILFAVADRLEVPLDKLLTDVDLNLEYVSTYKMSRAMVASKEYASAIPLLKDLLETPRAQLSTMDLMYDLAECYLYTADLEQAEELFGQVLELAILRQDHQLIALVLKNLGLIEFQRKKYQLAAYQWQKALEELDRANEEDLYLRACVLFNLGLTHKRLGKIEAALSYYNQASKLYEGVDNMQEMAKVYMGLGQSYKQLGDLERAVEYSERATAIFEGLQNIATTLQLKMNIASLYGLTGREAEAVALMEQVIAREHELGHPIEEGVAYVELARLRLRQHNLTGAKDACDQGLKLLPTTHPHRGHIHRILGEVALLEGSRDDGIRRLQKAADCFKAQDEPGDWDATMYELARLYLEEQDFYRAYSILDEIRRYSRQILEERGIVL